MRIRCEMRASVPHFCPIAILTVIPGVRTFSQSTRVGTLARLTNYVVLGGLGNINPQLRCL